MPRFYQAKPGDTLTSIAFRFYGNGAEAARIQQANPVVTNPAILNPAWLLTIPDLPGSQLEPAAPLIGGDKDEVSLTVEDKQFYLWNGLQINFSIDTIDSFQFTLPWDPFNDNLREMFTPYQYKQAGVSIGGEKVITGTIVKHDPEKTADSSTLTISGYGLPGILADVNPPLSVYPLEFVDNDLEQISQRLCDPFGVKVVFDADKGAAFKKITISPTDKILDWLIKLAKQRGLIVTSNEFGELVFQQTTNDAAKATIKEGRYPYLSSNGSFDGQKRFSTVTAIGDKYFGKESSNANAKDNTVKANRTHVFTANNVVKGELQKAADAKIGHSFASSIGLGVSLTGWRDSDGDLWKKNTKIVYESPSSFIYKETDFIVKDVILTKEPNALTSSLVLVFPETYTGKIRSSYPWD
jgi:prophage tail gpP-like protein/phage tail protein X